jgi:lipase
MAAARAPASRAYAVAGHLGMPVHLVGFSWGGATALRVASVAPELVGSLTVIEPEAYGLLRTEDAAAYAQISGLRDRTRAHIRADRWYEAYEEFVDFHNGAGSFARWPAARRDAFLDAQRARGDLWDVLFGDLITPEALAGLLAPVHVIEGSESSTVDHAICDAVLRHGPHARHTLIPGAGHMMPLTHPERLTRALLAGLGRQARKERKIA